MIDDTYSILCDKDVILCGKIFKRVQLNWQIKCGRFEGKLRTVSKICFFEFPKPVLGNKQISVLVIATPRIQCHQDFLRPNTYRGNIKQMSRV